MDAKKIDLTKFHVAPATATTASAVFLALALAGTGVYKSAKVEVTLAEAKIKSIIHQNDIDKNKYETLATMVVEEDLSSVSYLLAAGGLGIGLTTCLLFYRERNTNNPSPPCF